MSFFGGVGSVSSILFAFAKGFSRVGFKVNVLDLDSVLFSTFVPSADGRKTKPDDLG